MTRDEFNSLPAEVQATLRAGALMQRLLADKDTAPQAFALAERAQKAATPGYRTSEELAQPYVDRALAEVNKKFAERDAATAQREAETRLERQIASAKDEHGYTDEGIKRILENMQQNGVGDFATAMKADLHDHPNVTSTPQGSAEQMDWNFHQQIGQGENKAFFDGSAIGAPSIEENPDAWGRAAALRYLDGSVKLPA